LALTGGALAGLVGAAAVPLSSLATAGAAPKGSVYRQTNLVSDIAGVARKTDPNLVNPWGMSEFPGGPLWVSDNGIDSATLYQGDQHGTPLVPLPLVVSIPDGAPTGQVFNGTGQFVVHSGMSSGSALFLFASENGDITGWAPQVPPSSSGPSTQAQIGYSDPTAVYKGLAINPDPSAPRLYATNFRKGTIDELDGNFHLVPHTGKFEDPTLPAGFAPFGIANLGGKLYVTYAKQDAAKHDDVASPGNGFVDVYSLDGTLQTRLISNGALNSPWGLILATRHFGTFSNDLLVGNFGDGTINVFNPTSGAFIGTLTNRDGDQIQINGLSGLIFGDQTAGNANTLFFSVGIGDESHGLLGTLAPQNGEGH
jgi:uncharacterized protein (TIGR03118 family)